MSEPKRARMTEAEAKAACDAWAARFTPETQDDESHGSPACWFTDSIGTGDVDDEYVWTVVNSTAVDEAGKEHTKQWVRPGRLHVRVRINTISHIVTARPWETGQEGVCIGAWVVPAEEITE